MPGKYKYPGNPIHKATISAIALSFPTMSFPAMSFPALQGWAQRKQVPLILFFKKKPNRDKGKTISLCNSIEFKNC